MTLINFDPLPEGQSPHLMPRPDYEHQVHSLTLYNYSGLVLLNGELVPDRPGLAVQS